MTDQLPHLEPQGLSLSDGGLETSLIFRQGIELQDFAAYPLVESPDGVEALTSYLRPFVETARRHGLGFVYETPTWRSNPDWGRRLGHDAQDLDAINRFSVELLRRAEASDDLDGPTAVSGAIGPRGDGYVVGELMTAEEAARYHRAQIESFAAAGADVVTSFTITNAPEALGIAIAAEAVGVPAVIGLTVETDGRLPSGDDLGVAIERIDEVTSGSPVGYMVNCAHPTHFDRVLADAGEWSSRITTIRANASTCTHAELDAATELDDGDPEDLGRRYRDLARVLPALRVLGGCCGTDERHIAEIAAAAATATGELSGVGPRGGG